MTERKNGVYRVKMTDPDTKEIMASLGFYVDGEWSFFGDDRSFTDEVIVEVGAQIHWMWERDTYMIYPDHKRAQFMNCEIEGAPLTGVCKINIATQEITVENLDLATPFTYTDRDGNSEEFWGLQSTFHPKHFKVYDSETEYVYAEWNDYDQQGTNQ